MAIIVNSVLFIVLFLLQHKMVKRIGRENILIINVQAKSSTANLLLRQLNGQHFVIGEGHLLQDYNITIAILERCGVFKCHGRCKLDNLGVRCLGLFLVSELETHFVNVELDIGTVLDGEVQEELVADRIDVVQTNDHPVHFRADIPDSCRRVPYLTGIAGHILCR